LPEPREFMFRKQSAADPLFAHRRSHIDAHFLHTGIHAPPGNGRERGPAIHRSTGFSRLSAFPKVGGIPFRPTRRPVFDGGVARGNAFPTNCLEGRPIHRLQITDFKVLFFGILRALTDHHI
jgi:hypothetical protein